MLEGLADAVLIDLVHGAPDAAADQEAEQGTPRNGRQLAIAVADLGAEETARSGAQEASD